MREVLSENGIDLMIIPADRQEMMGCAYACFQKNIPIVHFLAGSSGSGIHDEVIRFMFSKMSYIMLCQTTDDADRLISMGEEKWRTYVVGTTAFDDLKIDEEYCPDFEYDLVLYHPDTISFPQMYHDLQEIDELIKDSEYVFILCPNPDQGADYIVKWIDKKDKEGRFVIKDNLSREKFLCLLKYAQRFIGNSSAGIFECPYFGTEFINIGYRNKDRKTEIIPGASDKILKILEGLEIEEDKIRKVYE
jgi:UDP-hydrolysing UDP-N-acetyl-D-glucosamine 2-epimerase